MSFRLTRSKYVPITGVALLVAGAICFTGGVAWGGPASQEPFTAIQPDGSTFVAVMGGDEWFNWYSHEGVLVVQDEAGWWWYAREVKGALEPGVALVAVDAPPADVVTVEDVPGLAASAERPEGIHASPAEKGTQVVNHPVLVILVEFQDRAISTSDAYWSNLFFGTSGNTVSNYYDEVSGGNLVLYPAGDTYGSPDGVVRVQLQASDHNAGNHPDPGSTIDDRNRWIVYDALYRADPYVSFNTYDTAPANGYITPNEMHIVFVIAGYERGYGDLLTPAVFGHRWALGFTYVENVPGVLLDSTNLCTWVFGDSTRDSGYMQVGELHGDHSGTMGEICHELGHDLGLPDLYDTTYASYGIGGHGLMAFGGWGKAAGDAYLGQTPTHLCAWSKDQLGFVTPVVASTNGDQTLFATGSDSYNAVRINTSDANQYFLIENRQLQGFDAGLYRWFSTTSGGGGGGGLAIWHIDESVANNNDETHKKVDLEEANQGTLGYSELDTLVNQGNRHHYFYAGYVALFGDATTPNSRLYNGAVTYLNVSSVSMSDSVMKCYVAAEPSTTRTLEWSTFLGGWQREGANGVAIDQSDNIYVVGVTASSDFPTTPGAYDRTMNGYAAIFLSKFSSGGTLISSTLFDTPGASSAPTAYNVAVDNSQCPYVTGQVYGYLTTTPGAYDTTYAGYGYSDGFVTKFDAALASLAYSTYLGGSNYDVSWDIAVDASGNAHVTGSTASSDFPRTLGSYGSTDVFVTKFNSTGTGLLYSRLFGTQNGAAHGITVDAGSSTYICGYIYSATLPTTTGAWDTTYSSPGFGDAFVTKLGSAGSIDYSTYLGGSHQDQAEELEVDSGGFVYVTGFTSSSDFPSTAGVYDQTYNLNDIFVTKLHPSAYSGLTYSTFVGTTPETDHAYGIDIDGSNNAYFGGYRGLSTDPSHDATLFGLNPSASSLIVSLYFVGTARDDATALAVDSNGAIYVVGFTESSDFPVTPGAYDTSFGGAAEAFILKYGWLQVTKSLVVGEPDGGEVWYMDATVPIRWSSSGAGGTVKIELSRDGNDGPWETLYASTANDGVEDWTVAGDEASNCYLRITDTGDASLTDISNAGFLIVAVDCELADAPQAEQPAVVAKNRYLTFVPGNVGVQTALRVTLTDLPAPFEAFEGCRLFVGPPYDVSEVAGKPDATPPTFKAANLQVEPYCTDWGTIPLLHVFDNEIVPNGVYAVQAIDCLCDFGIEPSYSVALSVSSSRWGDFVGDDNSQPPNGTVNFVDVSCVVDKFKNLPGAPRKSQTDVSPDVPDKIVDFGDIPGAVDAFRGVPYPYSGPDECE